MPQHSQRYWVAALVVAWMVDFLFWGKPTGISFPIFVILALAAGYALLWFEKKRVNWASHLLVGLIVALAVVTALRSETFTRVLAGLFVLGGMGLLVITFCGGGWMCFRVLDYISAAFELLVVAIVRAASLRLFPAREDRTGRQALRQALWKKVVPVLRGLLLALPLVIFLAALLASADLVFADQLKWLFKSFDLSRLPEYMFRVLYILMLAYAFTGLYLQAILPTRWGAQPKEEVPAPAASKKPALFIVSQFLGATEAFVVLGSVNLLFAFFVAIQFRYFFGGQANITAAGYTFSEYARRGFFELVLVAVVSLLLYLSLNAVTRRDNPRQARAFTALAVLLVGLVWVILASAFQRLLLYEDAYGFTSLRTYTHIFIPWLGFLLLAVIVLQIVRREQYFGGLLLLTAFGFALTFGVINIDGLIVRQNVARARAGAELDGQYLVGLSDDALPALVREFNAPDQPAPVRDTLGAVLACRVHQISIDDAQSGYWQSYHPGRAAARQALVGVDLSAYETQVSEWGTKVIYGNQTFDCYASREMD